MGIEYTATNLKSELYVTVGVTPGKKAEPTFEIGLTSGVRRTSHTAPVWDRLFQRDRQGDMVGVTLINWLESQAADGLDFKDRVLAFAGELNDVLEGWGCLDTKQAA